MMMPFSVTATVGGDHTWGWEASVGGSRDERVWGWEVSMFGGWGRAWLRVGGEVHFGLGGEHD